MSTVEPPNYGTPPPPPPGGQPPFGAPGGPGSGPKNSGKALASMITGLVGLLTFCCGFFVLSSIAALVLGILGKKDIAASNGQLKGDGMALTGIITGALGLVALVVSIILIATGVIDTNFEYSS